MIENCPAPITIFKENPVNVYMGNLLFFFTGVITTYVLTSLSNGFRTEEDDKLKITNILKDLGMDKEKIRKLFEFVSANIDLLNDRLENTETNDTDEQELRNFLFKGNESDNDDGSIENQVRKKVKLDNDDTETDENEQQDDEMLESIFEEASKANAKANAKANEKKSGSIELPELENVEELEEYMEKLPKEQKKNLQKIAELCSEKQSSDRFRNLKSQRKNFNVKTAGRYATNAEISEHSENNKNETGKGEDDYKVIDAIAYSKESDNSEDKVESQERSWSIFS